MKQAFSPLNDNYKDSGEITVLESSDNQPLDEDELTEINLKPENESPHEQTKFYYLHEMSKDDLEQLKKEFKKLPEELEKLVAEHPYLFWYYRVKNYIVLGSNMLYLVFLINTSYEGIQSFVDVVSPGTRVSKPIGNGLAIPIALIDTVFHMFLYSALNEAAKSTIRYTLSEPWMKHIKRTISNAIEKPCNAIFEASKFAINEAVSLSVNLTSTMTEIIDIYQNMEDLPLAVKIPIISSILYLGNYYLKKYINPDYHEGLNFWFNNKNHPWLVGEIWRGNFAVPFQIFLQGLSTVGTRTLFYYYLAVASNETFNGLWFPVPMILLTVTWQSLCALYPYTFNHYMGNQEKIDALLKANIDWNKVDEYVTDMMNNLNINNATPEQLEKYKNLAINGYINSEKKLLEEKVIAKYGKKNLMTKEIATQLISRGALGGYFGYQIISSALMLVINEPISMSICGTIFGITLFAGVLYRAEKKRKLDEKIYEEIKQINNDKDNIVTDIMDDSSLPNYSFISKVIADTANIITGIANAASTIGSEARIFGTSTVTTIFIALTSIESSINSILFNDQKVLRTVFEACETVARVSSTPGTLYHRCIGKIKSITPTESLLSIYRPPR